MMDYDALIERIVKSSGLGKEEIDRRIEAKKAKLSGLISREGAAQIIASEIGISFEDVDAKIGELMPGMRRVNVVGKVINLFPVREFSKNNRQGKVANLILADETGNVRVVLWDTNHIALIEKGEVKEGAVVEIRNAGMRENEIHLGGFSEIKVSEKIIENVKTERKTAEKNICELQQGQNVRVRAVVVSVFSPRFFSVCPECGKKPVQEAEGFLCNEHGRIQPKERSLINLVLDDGTDTIRVTLFSDQIEKLINEGDLKDLEKFNVFQEDLLGAEVFISGQVRRNQLFNNLEIAVSDIEKVNVEKLIENLEKR